MHSLKIVKEPHGRAGRQVPGPRAPASSETLANGGVEARLYVSLGTRGGAAEEVALGERPTAAGEGAQAQDRRTRAAWR